MKKLLLPLMAFLLVAAVGCDSQDYKFDDDLPIGEVTETFVILGGDVRFDDDGNMLPLLTERSLAGPTTIPIIVRNTIQEDVTVTFALGGDAERGEDYLIEAYTDAEGEEEVPISFSGDTGTVEVAYDPEDGVEDVVFLRIIPLDTEVSEEEMVTVTLTDASAGGEDIRIGRPNVEQASEIQSTRTLTIDRSKARIVVTGAPVDGAGMIADTIAADTEPTYTFFLQNDAATRAITLDSLQIEGDDAEDFTLVNLSSDESYTIAAGDSLEVQVSFDPMAVNLNSAVLTYDTGNVPDSASEEDEEDGDSDPLLDSSTEEVDLDVFVRGGSAAVPDALALDAAGEDDARETVTVTNDGNEPIEITDATITGPDADAFSIGFPAAGVTLDPGESVDFVVVYEPAEDDTETATATLTFDLDGAPFMDEATVSLTGTPEEEDDDA